MDAAFLPYRPALLAAAFVAERWTRDGSSLAVVKVLRDPTPARRLFPLQERSALLGALADFPRVLAQAAELREPYRVARFAEELAGLYHRWYDACRVAPQGDEPVGALNRTRLWLNDATGQVLRTALTTVGVSAPERM